MAVATWETIGHRLTLALTGRLSAEEAARMVTEKIDAAQEAAAAATELASPEQILAPYHRRVVANAQRLRAEQFDAPQD